MCSRECEWIRIRDEWEVEVGGRSADIMREAVKREIKGFEAKWTDNRSRIIVYWVGIDPGVSYCSKKINSKILHRGFSKWRWRKILLLVAIAVCLRRNTTERRPIRNYRRIWNPLCVGYAASVLRDSGKRERLPIRPNLSVFHIHRLTEEPLRGFFML